MTFIFEYFVTFFLGFLLRDMDGGVFNYYYLTYKEVFDV